MPYGLRKSAFIEHGPAAKVIEAQRTRSAARTWRALDHEHRIALIERTLNPANDLIDAYLLAL